MDSSLLVIVLFMVMGKNPGNSTSGMGNINNFINTMELDDKYTLEKIKMAKKIGPYFPENYIPLINNSISFAEKFIKINEVLDFMKKDDQMYILEHIPMDNNKDRFNKIISIIQKESPKSKINKNGTIIDMILNMDKYQKIFGMLSKVMSNESNISDPSQLIKLMGPLMGNEMEDNNAKFKEMMKMMEMMKVLDNPKKKPI